MVDVLVREHRITDLLELAAEHARRALGAASVSISRIDEEHDLVRTAINVGDLGSGEVRWPKDEVYPIEGDARLMGTMRQQRSLVDSINDPDCIPGERELLNRLGKGSSLATPIIVDGVVWAGSMRPVMSTRKSSTTRRWRTPRCWPRSWHRPSRGCRGRPIWKTWLSTTR
ncbi:GAF domain-containing protein [Aeromicrobium sp. UC242_57]